MRIHDISLTITPDLPTWPGDPRVELSRIQQIEDGSDANVSRMSIGVHTGTHVDAPYHFMKDGTTVDTLPLEVLIGAVQVVELGNEIETISAGALEKAGLIPGVSRILFKTRNSSIWTKGNQPFQKDFVALDASGAKFLVAQKIQLVGIDYLSIAPFNDPVPTHQILLKAGIVVIEGVDLSQINAGVYQLACLPLKLGATEGAPARVVLIEE